jgi:hypothetical protein
MNINLKNNHIYIDILEISIHKYMIICDIICLYIYKQ